MSDGSDSGYRIRAKNIELTLCEEEPQLGLLGDGNSGLQVLLPPRWMGCVKRIEDSLKNQLNSYYSKCGPQISIIGSPGNLLETQGLGPHTRLTESEPTC